MSQSNDHNSPWLNRLRSVDLFGAPIHFHIHQHTQHKSILGGILSLIVIFTITTITVTLIVNTVSNPNEGFLSATILADTNTLELNSSNFIFAVEVNNTIISKENSLYSITFQEVITSNGVTLTQSLGTVKCTQDYLINHVPEIPNINSRNMFCPKVWHYPIEGNAIRYIQMQVNKCQNSTNSVIVCAPSDQIDTYFNDPKNIASFPISIHLTNHLTNLYEHKDPHVTYLKTLSFMMPGGYIGRHSDMFLLEEKIGFAESVFNYLENNKEEETLFTLQDNTVDQIVYAAQGSFFELNIKKNNLQKKWERSYVSIEETLAFLGGLSRTLMIIASVIAIPYNRFYYNLAISNEIYQFESRPKAFYQKTMRNLPWKKPSKTFANIDAFNSNQDQFVEESSVASNEKQNHRLIQNEKISYYHPFFESLLFRHYKLNYRISELFRGFFCCKRRNFKIKHDLYRQASERLRKDVDLITILKKLQDIDKLKQLLLTRDQLELFNYKRPLKMEYLGQLRLINQVPSVSRRQKSLENTPKEDLVNRFSLYLHERPLETVEQFKVLFESYKELAKDSSNNINVKLMGMLGPDLLKIFQKIDDDYQRNVANMSRKSSFINNRSSHFQKTIKEVLEDITMKGDLDGNKDKDEMEDNSVSQEEVVSPNLQGLRDDEPSSNDKGETPVNNERETTEDKNTRTMDDPHKGKKKQNPSKSNFLKQPTEGSDIYASSDRSEGEEIQVQAMNPKYPMNDNPNQPSKQGIQLQDLSLKVPTHDGIKGPSKQGNQLLGLTPNFSVDDTLDRPPKTRKTVFSVDDTALNRSYDPNQRQTP